LDFLSSKEKFKIDGDLKRKLLETIKKDTAFFARCEIIDYSLLVGVHQKNLHNHNTNNSVYLNTE
jgi:Phosphatidylinositol-4-phosphate 5-Kinase